MDNTEKMIEKYKADMLNFSRRSIFQNEENVAVSAESVVSEEQKTNESDADSNYFGFLKVMVFAGNEAFPVETARVEVFDRNGGQLYSLLTDSGGIAEGMVLAARSGRENDHYGGEDGFSVYEVRVSHPDYETQIFDEVQIFENTETIQNVFFQTDGGLFPTGDEMNE